MLVGMKCGAQSGLKLLILTLLPYSCRNEVWCPVGIETKLYVVDRIAMSRNEVWCPVGIETAIVEIPNYLCVGMKCGAQSGLKR